MNSVLCLPHTHTLSLKVSFSFSLFEHFTKRRWEKKEGGKVGREREGRREMRARKGEERRVGEKGTHDQSKYLEMEFAIPNSEAIQ